MLVDAIALSVTLYAGFRLGAKFHTLSGLRESLTAKLKAWKTAAKD